MYKITLGYGSALYDSPSLNPSNSYFSSWLLEKVVIPNYSIMNNEWIDFRKENIHT